MVEKLAIYITASQEINKSVNTMLAMLSYPHPLYLFEAYAI